MALCTGTCTWHLHLAHTRHLAPGTCTYTGAYTTPAPATATGGVVVSLNSKIQEISFFFLDSVWRCVFSIVCFDRFFSAGALVVVENGRGRHRLGVRALERLQLPLSQKKQVRMTSMYKKAKEIELRMHAEKYVKLKFGSFLFSIAFSRSS